MFIACDDIENFSIAEFEDLVKLNLTSTYLVLSFLFLKKKKLKINYYFSIAELDDL